MKIGLIDVDGHHYPNLALMKLSAWHKSQGDTVEWWWGWGQYDRVYMAYTVKPAGGIAKKIDCQQCGKRRYGVTYQIEKK